MKNFTRNKFRFIFCSLLTLLFFNSCELKDSPEQLPSFVSIDSITVSAEPTTQGSNSQNITEAWLYVEGRLQGIYDLPMNVPVLNTGKKDIFVLAGIKRDGSANTRVDYPFYAPYRDTIEFKQLDTIKLNPVVNYYENLSIWYESFEDAGSKFDKNSFADTGLFVTNNKNEVYEGNGSGKIVLGTSKKSGLVNTSQKFKLPKGVPVFAEIDYKTNQDLIIGLIARFPNSSVNDNYSELVYLLPTNNSVKNGWKKAYINLSTKISQLANFNEFDLYIHLRRNGLVNEPEAIIDNVKIVYRK